MFDRLGYRRILVPLALHLDGIHVRIPLGLARGCWRPRTGAAAGGLLEERSFSLFQDNGSRIDQWPFHYFRIIRGELTLRFVCVKVVIVVHLLAS